MSDSHDVPEFIDRGCSRLVWIQEQIHNAYRKITSIIVRSRILAALQLLYVVRPSDGDIASVNETLISTLGAIG
jgi:hypothetical protein